MDAPDPDVAQTIARKSAQRLIDADRVTPSLGIDVDEVGPGSARLSMTVAAEMLNGVRIAHGGYIFLLADSSFAMACNSYGPEAVARSGQIEFVAPAHQGERLTATATERSKNGRNGVYDVTVTNETGAVVAEFRGNSVDRPPKP